MRSWIYALLAAALLLGACAAEEGAGGDIAIIGGADGPTAIYLAGEDGPTAIIVAGEEEAVAEEFGAEETATDGAAASADAQGEHPVGDAQVQALMPTPEPTQAPRLAGVSIGIDPGHQEHANSDTEPIAPNSSERKQKVLSGTAGVRTRIPEYVTNLEISFKLRDALEALGATVYMTRESHDVDISNMERALMFNELNVDLALRIHCNGASDSSVHGAGTYVRKTGEKQEESELAGELILDALCEATGARRCGVYLRDTYTGQNWSTVPCVMVETGYMSNPEEDELLNDPAYQEQLAQGIAEGVCRYIEAVSGGAIAPRPLQEGSRGGAVERLQQKLIELGYLDGDADGIYGPKTAAAVSAYQAANGLEQTGAADIPLQEALLGE